MSTLKTINIAHPDSVSNDVVLDSSGNVNIDSGTLYADAVNNRVGVGTTAPAYNIHGSGYLGLGTQATSGSGAGIHMIPSSTLTNWFVGSNYVTPGTFQIIPSLTGGGSTFTTPAITIDSSGRLLVGTSTAYGNGLLQIQGDANDATDAGFIALRRGLSDASIGNGTTLGAVNFAGSGTGIGASVSASTDAGTWGSGYRPSRLVFSTTADGDSSPTERMRITSAGRVAQSGDIAGSFVFKIQNDGNNVNRYGLEIQCGADDASGTNYAVQFYDGDGTTQGAITFSGGAVTYGPFTAHHPCILPDADNEAGYPYGTLLEITSIEYTQKYGQDTERGILYNVRKTQAPNSRAVLGAYGSSMNGGPDGETNRHQALVLGDGHILCNNSGGNIKIGDGICSSATPGIGQKATATPSMAIGIAQEDVTFADGEEVKLVAVQYGLHQFTPWGD